MLKYLTKSNEFFPKHFYCQSFQKLVQKLLQKKIKLSKKKIGIDGIRTQDNYNKKLHKNCTKQRDSKSYCTVDLSHAVSEPALQYD